MGVLPGEKGERWAWWRSTPPLFSDPPPSRPTNQLGHAVRDARPQLGAPRRRGNRRDADGRRSMGAAAAGVARGRRHAAGRRARWRHPGRRAMCGQAGAHGVALRGRRAARRPPSDWPVAPHRRACLLGVRRPARPAAAPPRCKPRQGPSPERARPQPPDTPPRGPPQSPPCSPAGPPWARCWPRPRRRSPPQRPPLRAALAPTSASARSRLLTRTCPPCWRRARSCWR